MDNYNTSMPEKQPKKEPGELNALHGISALAMAGILLIFVGAPVQAYLGMAGLAITELLILATAVLPFLIFGLDFRKVFQFRTPQKRQVAGTVMVWMGFWGITIASTMIIAYFFPERYFSLGTDLTGFFSSVPFVLQVLVIALMPAICEEAMFRGLLQHSLHRVNKWVAMVIVGVLFGLFHMDPIRSLPTGILGVGLAYVTLKSDNMILPMGFHFLHNFTSISISAISVFAIDTLRQIDIPQAAETASISTEMVFTSLFFVLGAPAAILIGSVLLEPRRPSVRGRFRDKTPQIVVASVCTGLIFICLVAGMAISFAEIDWIG